jgi:hypothetical protein
MGEDLDRTRRHLQDARLREHVLTVSEQEIRDPLQALVTVLYLLQTSQSLCAADCRLVDDMCASCDEPTRVLRERLDQALNV